MDAKKLAEQSAREMESLLSCPICLDTFTKPVVILPCQHNLCRKCADDCFEQRGRRYGISGGSFKCPQCRYEVILDRHGTFSLPRNLLVENIIDMMEADKLRVENQFKDKIKEEEQRLEEIKKREQALEDQKLNKMCPEHKETLNVYCLSCAKLVCATCKVFGDCQTCTVVRMEQAYDQHQNEMREAIELITNSSDRVNSMISHCNDMKKRVDDIDNESRKLVIVQFEKMFSALENKKSQLLNKITSVTQETSKILVGHKNQYQNALETSSNDIAEALTLCNEEDHIVFLKNARPLIDNLLKSQGTLEQPLPNVQPPNSSKWRIDLNPLVEVVKKIDFSSDIRFKQSSKPKTKSVKSDENMVKSINTANSCHTLPASEDKLLDNLTENSNIMSLDAEAAKKLFADESMQSSSKSKSCVSPTPSTKKKQSTLDKLHNMMLGNKDKSKNNANGNSSTVFNDLEDDYLG